MRFATILLIATLLTITASCSRHDQPTTKLIYTPVVIALPLPTAPALPAITAEQIACLPDSTVQSLILRELLLSNHIDALEMVIKATHTDRRD